MAAWRRLPALRSERARAIFRRLEPELVRRMAGAASPDDGAGLARRLPLPPARRRADLLADGGEPPAPRPPRRHLRQRARARPLPRRQRRRPRRGHLPPTSTARSRGASELRAQLAERLRAAPDYEARAQRRPRLDARAPLPHRRPPPARPRRARGGGRRLLRRRRRRARRALAGRHRRVRHPPRAAARRRRRRRRHGQARQPRDDRDLRPRPHRHLRRRRRRGLRRQAPARRHRLLRPPHPGADLRPLRPDLRGHPLQGRHAPAPLRPLRPGRDLARPPSAATRPRRPGPGSTSR